MDPREYFIVSSICVLTGQGEAGNKAVHNHVSGASEVTLFLEDPSCSILVANVDEENNIRLSNQTGQSISWDGTKVEIHFMKNKPESISAENIIKTVQVTTVLNSPVSSLYNSLKSLYAPALLKNTAWSDKLPPRVQGLLAELEQSLKDTVRDSAAHAQEYSGDLKSFQGILTPTDEFQFWMSFSGTTVDREAVRKFNDAFEPLRQGFEKLDELQPTEVEELIEQAFTSLDDVWKADGISSRSTYPQERMTHLLDVMGGSFSRYAQKYLAALDLWKGPFAEIRSKITSVVQVIDKWCQVPLDLTSTYWPGHKHDWKGSTHEDTFTFNLGRRLEKILDLRSTHEQLVHLLTAEEARQLRLDDSFRAFDSTQPLFYNPYTQAQWESAVAIFERSWNLLRTRLLQIYAAKYQNF